MPDSSSTKPREAATQPVSAPVGILNPREISITRQAAFKSICAVLQFANLDRVDPQEIIEKAAPLSEWALEPYLHPGKAAIIQPDTPPEPEPNEPESVSNLTVPDVETKAMHIEIRRLCKADGGDGKAEWKKVMDTFDLITAPEGITDKKLLSRIIDDFGVPF